MTLNVYFATPIDAVLAEHYAELNAMRDLVRDVITRPQFSSSGDVMLFEPAMAWSITSGADTPDPRLQAVNYEAVRRSDLVLALLPSWCSTVGAPMEIEYAARRGIPVFVVRDKPSWALQQENIYQFKDLESALSAISDYVPTVRRTKPKVKWVQTAKNLKADPEPSLAYPNDAGFDLTFCGEDDIVIPPGGAADVPSSVAMEFPPGVWGFLVGRSSSFRNRGLLVNPAIIDPGFRGELFAIVRNISGEHQRISPGQRIAQIVPLPALAPGMEVMQVPELSPSERGANGFGSSGL